MVFGKKKSAAANVDVLREVSFFEGFTDDELHRVAQLVQEVDALRGAELTDQGKPGQVCYVIVDGSASVIVGTEVVAVLGPGSMVGEMALIDHRPRSATVVADGPMNLLSLDTKSFQTLLEEMPKARDRVMAVLQSRLGADSRRAEGR